MIKTLCILLFQLFQIIVCTSAHLNVNHTHGSNNNTLITKISSSNNRTIVNKTSLYVIYLIPKDENRIYTLNEKNTFGSGYKKGWILPSITRITLNLTLYYDGPNERAVSRLIDDTKNLKNDDFTINHPQHNALYMYFTNSKLDCNDYHQEHHTPIRLVERINENLFRVQVNVMLTYADEPYFLCLQQIDYDHNRLSSQLFAHQGNDYWLTIITTRDIIPLWARVTLFACLLILSGLFSGLNLGLMSLDLSELEILKKIGTRQERSYAAKIYPLRKRGNFLLCTILLGNVLVNSTSTLILGDLLSGLYAALGSTILIVLFGEIIPQAACSKHGLAVGAYTRYIMYFFMILTSPISFPLSKILDWILGKEIAATYNREKIRELMKNVKDLEEKEFKMISGALDFSKRIVRDIMTPLKDVFMLDLNSKLDFGTIAEISQKGFSRIPVYESARENVCGLLHVKDFTLLDPDDNMPVKALLEFYNHKVTYCYLDDKLDQMFDKFRQGETHLAFVIQTVQDQDKDPYHECVGIITLEDIIEELVQLEIYDEFDDKKEIEKMQLKERLTSRFETMTNSMGGSLASIGKKSSFMLSKSVQASKDQLSKYRSDIGSSLLTLEEATGATRYEPQTSHDLSFFIQQQKSDTQTLLSPQLRLASFQFLCSSVKPFTHVFLTKNVLELIFKKDVFKESRRLEKGTSEYLYQYGKACNYFILILIGEAIIEVGKEKLEFVAGQFAYFGVNALLCDCETSDKVLQESDVKLKTKQYIPDFSLRVDERCVYFKLDRDLWRTGVRRSRYEQTHRELSLSIDLESISVPQCLPTEVSSTIQQEIQVSTNRPPGESTEEDNLISKSVV